MITLTEDLIRTSFINASKGAAQRAQLPELDAIDFEQLDLLGWQDPKRPTQHYVSLEVDRHVRTLLLRGAERPPAKKLLCSWCEDIVDGNQAALFVAPLAGESGRRGNTVGTAICADLRCSRNVRRAPSSYELRSEDPALLEYHQQQKIAGLQERSARFVRTVMAG